jgi:hypothetical protein
LILKTISLEAKHEGMAKRIQQISGEVLQAWCPVRLRSDLS